VLLGQLAANGDCVYATTIARQIKADDPACHLTWAIGSPCRGVIEHNPHVDDVWVVDYEPTEDMATVWQAFERKARERQRRGEFDDIYLTQINPGNFRNFDGTVRASIFRGYPRPISVPVTPVIRLSQAEIDKVARFAGDTGLTGNDRVVLFESSPRSGQSAVTPEWARVAADAILAALPGSRVVMTSGMDGQPARRDVVDASNLAFREIAELSRYCSLLVGCSSGLTWLLTSDAAVTVPTIQVLSKDVGQYGAVVHDLEHWGLPSDHVIELHDSSPAYAARVAVAFFNEGLASARLEFHEQLPLSFTYYVDTMFGRLRQGEVRAFVRSLVHTTTRYGLRSGLARDLVKRAVSRVAARSWRLLPKRDRRARARGDDGVAAP
jgi:hypothetical protein